jgi:hypothetical protein
MSAQRAAHPPMTVDAHRLALAGTGAEIVMKREIATLLAPARAPGCRIAPGRDAPRKQMPPHFDFFGLAGELAYHASPFLESSPRGGRP